MKNKTIPSWTRT